jgi:hypothetical protein
MMRYSVQGAKWRNSIMLLRSPAEFSAVSLNICWIYRIAGASISMVRCRKTYLSPRTRSSIRRPGYDAGRDENYLEIRDAETLDMAARIWMGQHFPLGFHGNFTPTLFVAT